MIQATAHDNLPGEPMPMKPARTLSTSMLACACLLAGLLLSPSAASAAGKDCAPMGSLPNYLAIGAPEQYVFQSHDFLARQKDDSNERTTIAGHYCKQEYDLKEGAEAMSALEMISNYQDQLDQLGAKTVYTDDAQVNAVLTRDGHETWIEVDADDNLGEVHVIVVDKQPVKLTLLAPSGNDYRLLGHMPTYVAGKPDKANFDQHEFLVHSEDGNNWTNVQGTRFDLEYDLKKGAPEVSDIEILENYRHALEQLGAVILYTGDDDNDIVARYDDHGQAIWMEIGIDGSLDEIHIHVIEEKAFQASIKPPDAGAMKTALDKDGHVALHINFDFDKATLRPDAAPIIAQVVTLLQDNPDLKLSIEGNTDNIGGHDYNVKLSQDRAAAVVAALVQAGVATDRLTSAGNGPDKPVADNDSSRGRARNRRVELVKR